MTDQAKDRHARDAKIAALQERIRTLEAQIASEHELPRPGEAGSLEDGKKGT